MGSRARKILRIKGGAKVELADPDPLVAECPFCALAIVADEVDASLYHETPQCEAFGSMDKVAFMEAAMRAEVPQWFLDKHGFKSRGGGVS